MQSNKTARNKMNVRKEKTKMKKFAIASAALFFAAMATSAFASCDTRKSDEDEQAMCASKCEDAYLKDQQGWTADMSKVKANKVACDAKCNCPQNSANLK